MHDSIWTGTRFLLTAIRAKTTHYLEPSYHQILLISCYWIVKSVKVASISKGQIHASLLLAKELISNKIRNLQQSSRSFKGNLDFKLYFHISPYKENLTGWKNCNIENLMFKNCWMYYMGIRTNLFKIYAFQNKWKPISSRKAWTKQFWIRKKSNLGFCKRVTRQISWVVECEEWFETNLRQRGEPNIYHFSKSKLTLNSSVTIWHWANSEHLKFKFRQKCL